MQTKTFACACLDTDQDMKASFSCVTRAGNSNLNTQRVFREWPRLAWKAQIGLHVQVMVQSCRQAIFIFHAQPPPPPNSAESAPKSRQYLSNWRKPSKALKRTELRTPPSDFQLAKPLGAFSKHENPKPACAVHASAIVSFPEPVFPLLSLGHITGCDLVRIPNGWASVSLGDRLFSDSRPF